MDSRPAAPSSVSQQAAGESNGNHNSPSAQQEEYGKKACAFLRAKVIYISMISNKREIKEVATF